MVFHAIWRLILKYRFCAISSRELSVCAIFYAFYNSADHTIHRMQFHIESSICFEILVKHICWHHCKGSTQAVQRGRNQYQCHRHFGGKPFWSPSFDHLSSKINFIQWSPIWSQQRFTRQGRERYLAEFGDLQVLLLHQCWVLSFWRAGGLSLCCKIDSHSFPLRNVWWSSQVGPMTGFRLEDLVTRQLDMF